jgi:hypothetical protein
MALPSKRLAFLSVIAGLDPAIHPLRKSPAKKMDARVKPAHDGAL